MISTVFPTSAMCLDSLSVIIGRTVDLDKFADSQKWLQNHGARLAGSRANGTNRADSDWDYFLPLDILRNELKPLLNKQGVYWDSPIVGAITWWPEGTQIEVSDMFAPPSIAM